MVIKKYKCSYKAETFHLCELGSSKAILRHDIPFIEKYVKSLLYDQDVSVTVTLTDEYLFKIKIKNNKTNRYIQTQWMGAPYPAYFKFEINKENVHEYEKDITRQAKLFLESDCLQKVLMEESEDVYKYKYESSCFKEEVKNLKQYFEKLFLGFEISIVRENWDGDKYMILKNKNSLKEIHCIITSEKNYMQNEKEYEKYIEDLGQQLLLDYKKL